MKALIIPAAALLLAATPAQARDPQNTRPWDYNNRDNPAALSKAILMSQVESGGSGAAGGAAGSSSVANMTIVNVSVGDNSSADVKVQSDQSNLGDIDATAVTATGSVDIGAIGSGRGFGQ